MKIKINKNLKLRTVKMKDAADIFSFASNNDVTNFLTYSSHKNIDMTKKVIKNLWLASDNPFTSLVIEYNGKVVGTCNVTTNNEGINEIGYQLHKDYWNKRIMTKCLFFLIDTFFKKTNENLHIWADLKNIASYKLIEKMLFKKSDVVYKKIKQKNNEYYFEHSQKSWKIVREQITSNVVK